MSFQDYEHKRMMKEMAKLKVVPGKETIDPETGQVLVTKTGLVRSPGTWDLLAAAGIKTDPNRPPPIKGESSAAPSASKEEPAASSALERRNNDVESLTSSLSNTKIGKAPTGENSAALVSLRTQRQVENMGTNPGMQSNLHGFRDMEERNRQAEACYIEEHVLKGVLPDHVFSLTGVNFDQHGRLITHDTMIFDFVGGMYGATRYIRICGVSKQEMDEEVLGNTPIGRLKTMNIMKGLIGIRKFGDFSQYKYGQYMLRFDDLRESAQALTDIRALNRWYVEYVRPATFHNVPTIETPNWTPNEATLQLLVFCRDKNGWLARVDFEEQMEYLKQDVVRVLREDFGDCVESITHDTVGDFHLGFKVTFFALSTTDRVRQLWELGRGVFTRFRSFTEAVMFAAWWDARQNPLLFLDRRGRGGRGRRYPDPASMGNLVHPDAIVAGLDHRTTVMLRNIPNKLQPWDLIRLVLWLRCNIDFVYLRIDFSNLCNVGYAFLNFVTPEDIIPFHNALANTKWNVYNSDKVAQICYATIQGRECLIERFRNSGVMTQWVPFRARLFVSSADPEGYMHPNVVGRDAPFPASNNQVKLQRSLDNAFHIGLYPPRPGDKAWRRPNDDNLETRHLDNRDPNVRQQILPTIYENSEALHAIAPAPAMPPMMMAPMGVAVAHPMLMPPPSTIVAQPGTAVPFHPMGNNQQQQGFSRPYIPPHARQH